MRVLIGGIDGIHLADSSSKDGPFRNLAITAAEKILSVLFLSVILAWLTVLLMIVVSRKIHYYEQLPRQSLLCRATRVSVLLSLLKQFHMWNSQGETETRDFRN